MKIFLASILCLFCVYGNATVYLWSGSTTGGITISNTSTSPSLVGGDVLILPANGNWNSVSFQNLTGSSQITIRFLAGHTITTTNAGFTGSWNTVNNVRIVGMTTHNYAGNPMWFREFVHDIVFDSCSFTNDPGSFPDKNWMRWDDNTSSAMNYDGTKNTTFYNIEIKNCLFNGIKNTNAITCGSDGIRSVCTDFNIHHNYFKNIVNDVHLSAILFEGTCFAFKFMYNRVDSILQPINAAVDGVHVGILTPFGYGEVAYNVFRWMYANTIRVNVLKWPGGPSPGYTGQMLIHDNLDLYHASFSSYEITNNNSTPRITALGLDTAVTYVYNNTTYLTNRDSYNGDYHGVVCDLITHNVHVYSNVIISPEHDRAWDPDASQSRYITAFISGNQPGYDSSNNHQYQWAIGVYDSVNNTLAVGSPLVTLTSSTVIQSTFDVYGNPRPGGAANTPGAIQFVATGAWPPNKWLPGRGKKHLRNGH